MPQTNELAHTKAGIYALWKFMVYTNDKAEFDRAWERLKDQFPEQKAIYGYLHRHYMPWKEEWAMGVRLPEPWSANLLTNRVLPPGT